MKKTEKSEITSSIVASRITARTNRIIGQLKGIQKMAESGRDCNEIIQQVSAVKKAIDSLTQELVMKDVMQYIPPIRQKEITEMIHRAISL